MKTLGWMILNDDNASGSDDSGGTAQAGVPVYVEGLAASASVNGDRALWAWTDANNLAHTVTNAFTVFSVRLCGDLNLDGSVDAADKALAPSLSKEYGWGMPAATNVFRPVRLRTDVGLSGGVYTLALSGTNGAFKVWQTQNPAATNSPLLVCGRTVTNGVNGVTFLTSEDSDLYVEALSNGTATLTYAYTGTGDAEGISCAAAMKMTAFSAQFVEDSATVYNFSPSLGETGTVKVAVSPEPPAAGIPGHHFKIEIVRETQGGGDQHIDWIDVSGDNTYGRSRGIDFDEMTFKWDGVPAAPFGSAATQAEGRDVFVGVAASTNRLLPAVTLGQPVPPPFVTAVASICRDSDGTVVAAARKRIFVPQVVKIEYANDAMDLLKQPWAIDGTNVIMGFSDNEILALKVSIASDVISRYGNAVNLRCGMYSSISAPYSQVSFISGDATSPLGNADHTDFGNVDAAKTARIYVYRHILSCMYKYIEDPSSFSVPVTRTEMGAWLPTTIAHEIGHLLGLVKDNDVLNGSSGRHNKYPWTARQIMNPGAQADSVDAMLWRSGTWSFKPINQSYIEFVLPVH